VAITVTNINTGGAQVIIGGVVNAADGDGFYIGLASGGNNIGATTGGVTITYTVDITEIFADQTLPPVDVALTSETATIEFDMLESNVPHIKEAVTQNTYDSSASANKLAAGGITTVNFVPLVLEITDNDTGLLTTWTFFKTLPGGFESNFERENPTTVGVTFTAYADTTHASGHQLFSVNEALT
jgi:hypothetical protein